MNHQTLNIKFVQEVEKYPCLYNFTLADYSRKDITEKAWSEVGKVSNLTNSQCKEKWKNLRAVFVRHTKPARSGSYSKNRKPYYLADVMQFTIPYIKARNNSISENHPQAVREVTEQEDNEEANVSLSILQQNIPLPSHNVPSPTQDIASPASASSTDIGSNRRRKEPLSTGDDGIIEYFKAKKAKLERKSEDIEDPKRMFLLSLLPDMKAMSESQTRTFKRRVLALVDEILEESPRT